jgi:chemotaxis response regulator CheB
VESRLPHLYALRSATAVQDPQEAIHAAMPIAAIERAAPDFVLPLAGLGALLHTVCHR